MRSVSTWAPREEPALASGLLQQLVAGVAGLHLYFIAFGEGIGVVGGQIVHEITGQLLDIQHIVLHSAGKG